MKRYRIVPSIHKDNWGAMKKAFDLQERRFWSWTTITWTRDLELAKDVMKHLQQNLDVSDTVTSK